MHVPFELCLVNVIFTVINTDKIRINNTNRCTVCCFGSHKANTSYFTLSERCFNRIYHISCMHFALFLLTPISNPYHCSASNDKCTHNKFSMWKFTHSYFVCDLYACFTLTRLFGSLPTNTITVFVVRGIWYTWWWFTLSQYRPHCAKYRD